MVYVVMNETWDAEVFRDEDIEYAYEGMMTLQALDEDGCKYSVHKEDD